MSKQRILSGMRPTGPLHLGHLHGALANWKDMQDKYDCFFFIADWHALTTNYEDTSNTAAFRTEMMIDWLSVGLDPAKSTFFVQSEVKEHAELFLILSMITPVPWLERNPTYKDQIVQMENKDLSTFGFLGYPVLQAADIIMYKAHGVPVGIDQVPHVELTREIVRRFNYMYGDVFVEPKAILTETPKLLGSDNRKMSKSYQNAINLADPPDVVSQKVSVMITDPQRMRKKDPGDPDICNVYSFHKIYSPPEMVEQVNKECRAAEIGCVQCKKLMAANLTAQLEPIYEKRVHFEKNRDEVRDIIKTGSDKAREVARATMEEVRAAVKI
ncbi:tryptophanyl-tRNA synthetase [Desulfatibacillum alkenivorans DSM 16219]|uniref:Tryptophan--tRNA ligase n=1 Tax=Desulfatibacillum alkenivorans DSM 16219 TaxID=1121393 RepID=A0A1M6C417_9BACT|nr:tryptophan--tRNA ligase [Desulfatibacillum alkenivorans]SHI55693.1 tryptophanyl-tRNA synthetase [Desulfatibacillum alkenivorans DSM 16219]